MVYRKYFTREGVQMVDNMHDLKAALDYLEEAKRNVQDEEVREQVRGVQKEIERKIEGMRIPVKVLAYEIVGAISEAYNASSGDPVPSLQNWFKFEDEIHVTDINDQTYALSFKKVGG